MLRPDDIATLGDAPDMTPIRIMEMAIRAALFQITGAKSGRKMKFLKREPGLIHLFVEN